jgi:catechol 2,3-dioxygenase-like lactoylglutathione lyase family enzyme
MAAGCGVSRSHPPMITEPPDVTVDLFAGIAVSDLARAEDWYARLLGAEPAFRPNDTEAVWEVAEHRYLYIELLPEHAGHALHTLFVDDLDAWVAQMAARVLEPAQRETYDNGVRKITYRDPDGNEIGFGGGPA